MATPVRQVLQALRDRREKEDDRDQKDELETKETTVLWDRRERVSWDLLGLQGNLESKDRKETQGVQVYRGLKENLVHEFQPLLLLFLQKS